MEMRQLIRRSTVVGAALVVVGVTAVSGSAAADAPERGDRAPDAVVRITEQVQALRADAPERATGFEFTDVRSVAGGFRAGGNDSPVAADLASRDQSRVLVESRRFGRVVLVPTKDGPGFCASFRAPGYLVEREVTCVAGLDDSGIAPSFGHDAVNGFIAYGIAADDVSGVDVHLASGAIARASLEHNVFVWSSLDLDDAPVALTSHRASGDVSVDLPAYVIGR